MTLILPRLTKRSLYTPELDEKEHRRQIDQDLQNVFVALRPSQVTTLVDEATILVDARLSFHQRVTLAGNRTMGNPTDGRDGQDLLFQITQDSLGSRTITWGSAYSFGIDIPEPTLSTTAGDVDLVLFLFDSPTDKWFCIGVSRGYS